MINAKELAAFARDMREMCRNTPCSDCKLRFNGYCGGTLIGAHFDPDAAITAVEEWHKTRSGKPCAEVIDKAMDIFTLEVEIERNGDYAEVYAARDDAKYGAGYLRRFYLYLGDPATVRVLSAKRFVLASHREDADMRKDAE